MISRLRSLLGLTWRLIEGTFSKDFSKVNRWKNHHLVGGDPSGTCVVAFFNDCFGDLLPYHDLKGPNGVLFTGNANRAVEADVVVFHVPTLRKISFEKRSGQLWVAWSLESTQNYPCLKNPDFLSQFDLTMTFQSTADVWFPYIVNCSKKPFEELQRPMPPKESTKLIASFISSRFNLSKRQEYYKELAQYIDIHSYGSFCRTHRVKKDRGRQSKLDTIRQYKFTIAFENSVEEDYVTEKFFDPLLAGSVPVYLGAPNVHQFAPGNHCYIDVRDFPNPKALAEYIQYLSQSDQAYSEYFTWKQLPYHERFIDMLKFCQSGYHPFEILSSLVLAKTSQAAKTNGP